MDVRIAYEIDCDFRFLVLDGVYEAVGSTVIILFVFGLGIFFLGFAFGLGLELGIGFEQGSVGLEVGRVFCLG